MIASLAKAIALVLLLQPSAAARAAAPSAQQPGTDTLFPSRPAGYLTDAAGLVDAPAAEQIEDLARRLQAATGAELAVVTLRSIGDREASEVAVAIGRAWGVGKEAEIGDARRNAGVVLLMVPRQDRRPGTGHIRIETGRGIEGIVTDAAAGGIREAMRPELEREDYGPALLTGTRALVSTIARGFGVSDPTLVSTQPVPAADGGRGRSVVNLLPIALFILFIILSSRGGGGRRGRRRSVYWGPGPWIGGGWGGGGGFGGGGFGGFGGGGGFSGGGAGGRF